MLRQQETCRCQLLADPKFCVVSFWLLSAEGEEDSKQRQRKITWSYRLLSVVLIENMWMPLLTTKRTNDQRCIAEQRLKKFDTFPISLFKTFWLVLKLDAQFSRPSPGPISTETLCNLSHSFNTGVRVSMVLNEIYSSLKTQMGQSHNYMSKLN